MTTQLNKADTVADITERLRKGLNPERIYLFGSHARGDESEESDFDILVIVPSSELPGYLRAKEAYRLLHGVSVSKDVIVMTRDEWERNARSGVSLANVIEKEGQLLYAV